MLIRNLFNNAKLPSIRYVSTANNVPCCNLLKKMARKISFFMPFILCLAKIMKIQEKLKLHFIYFNLSSSQLKMAHEGEQTEDESSKMMKT